MCLEKCKVVLFWDNATYQRETLQAILNNIKLAFLLKNTTSLLEPLDAGIIRNFKHKYRKLLLRYVVSRINEGKTASQIIENVHVLERSRSRFKPLRKVYSWRPSSSALKNVGLTLEIYQS